MAVEARDIIFFGSAVMAEDDSTSNIGGAIDRSVKMVFTDISTTEVLQVVSDNASDTNVLVNIYGRDGSGALVSEEITTNGTTAQSGATSFERILKVLINDAAGAGGGTTPVGTIAVIATTEERTNTTQAAADEYQIKLDASASSTDDAYKGMVFVITSAHASQYEYRECVKYDGANKIAYFRTALTATVGAGQTYYCYRGCALEKALGAAGDTVDVTEVRRPFYNVAADPSVDKDYYEKIYVYNLNGSTTLSNATINEQATGIYTKVHFALASTFGDSNAQTASNRVTAPAAGIGLWYDNTDGDIDMPNSKNFTNKDGCAVWLHLDLASGDTAQNSYYEMQVKGQTV